MSAAEPANVLVLMSDQHARAALGCYGSPVVQTPNLDALAASGTRFSAAYTPSPVCVPARASFATGRYVHQLACWDNQKPYTGAEAPSWGMRLAEQGHHVTTIGKLHYSEATLARAFPDQRLPMYVVQGAAIGHLRGEMPVRADSRAYVETAGEGESDYIRYDTAVADAAARWLRDEAPQQHAPWVLFVSLTTPHFPLRVPARYLSRYPPAEMPLPIAWHVDEWPRHPALEANRRLQDQQRPFTEAQVRRAVATYYGLVTFMDEQVGRVLEALADTGLQSSTRIIYTSDHGESLGEHGLWWKSNMYEGACAVPLVIAGPGATAGGVCETPVSLVDVFPTVVESAGAKLSAEDASLPGRSLWDIAATPGEVDRVAFSEYHDAFSEAGVFMLRHRNFKYVSYVGADPQLFDLEADPHETTDLAGEPALQDVRVSLHRRLVAIADPDDLDRRARSDQRRRIEQAGGAEAVAATFRHSYTPAPQLEG